MFRITVMISVLVLIFSPCYVTAQPPEESQLDVRPFDAEIDPDIDLFFSSWKESMPRRSFGCLVERDIFTRCDGDPMHPKTRGAVLTELKRFSHATLAAHASTTPAALEDEQDIFYIESGKGVIQAGGKTAGLYEGIGVLMPPGIEFTMTNTGEKPLTTYIIAEPIPEGFTPNSKMLVRDENVLPMHTSSGHWTHINKRLFRQEDGLAILVGMGPVWFDAMTMGQPHSHSPGVEEIWFALKGDTRILLGKELREFPPGTAYKIPPDSKTPHSTINATNEPVKTFWFMKNAKHTPEPYSQLDPKPYDPETEPDIDMYTGSYLESMPRHTHGALIERDVLTRGGGDPMNPDAKGAVLKYVNRFTHATLPAHNSTIPVTPKGEQELFYIISGKGTLTGGGETYELYPGITFLIPENLEFTMTNTGDEDMTMYLVVEPTYEGFQPKTGIVLHDENTAPIVTSHSHWAHIVKHLIRPEEGLAELQLYLTVYFAPNTFAQPHSHGEGVEEVWCTLSGDVLELLGKQIRILPPGTAFLIPPNGTTPHAGINVSDNMAKFFYFARFTDQNRRKK